MKLRSNHQSHPSFPSIPENHQIIGIGIDLEEVRRFHCKTPAQERLQPKVFTEAEIRYCRSKRNSAQHFAARFAAKEAFYKALGGNLPDEFGFHDVEVVHDALGAPHLEIHGEGLEHVSCVVSLSHSRELATAIVVAQRSVSL